MRDTTTTFRKNNADGEDSSIILPDKTFLGASETDIIALEREIRPGTTRLKNAEEGLPPDRRRG